MSNMLNDKQQTMVEDNHNLIYSFLANRGLSLDAVEDWYGTAAIGLCKAAITYDESRGVKFSTYAYVVMENEIRQIKRKERRQVQAEESLGTAFYGELTIEDTVKDPNDFVDDVVFSDTIVDVLRSRCDRDRLVIDLIMNQGYSQKKAAGEVGISQPQACRIYKSFINSILKHIAV